MGTALTRIREDRGIDMGAAKHEANRFGSTQGKQVAARWVFLKRRSDVNHVSAAWEWGK